MSIGPFKRESTARKHGRDKLAAEIGARWRKAEASRDQAVEAISRALADYCAFGEAMGKARRCIRGEVWQRWLDANCPEVRQSGIVTGFSQLDAMTDGLQNGELVVIGARPSVGKTAIMVDVIRECLVNEVPVAMFTCEMSPPALMRRLFCSMFSVPLQEVRTRRLTKASSAPNVAASRRHNPPESLAVATN